MAITELVKNVLQHATRANNLKLLLTLSAFFIYKYRSHAIGTRRRADLKEPKGAYPLLGHMPLLAMIPGTKLYDFFEKNYRELGPVWSISLPVIGRMIQGDTPEMVEHVLKGNFWAYEKGPIFKGALGDLFGSGKQFIFLVLQPCPCCSLRCLSFFSFLLAFNYCSEQKTHEWPYSLQDKNRKRPLYFFVSVIRFSHPSSHS